MPITHNWTSMLSALTSGSNLTADQADWCMSEIFDGEAPESAIGAFLAVLKLKGETVEEVIGFRDSVLQRALPLDLGSEVLDIVGTGGDKHGTVNVSTMSSIVAAASGVPVVKHGNRAATSKSGSSNVLESLGVDVSLSPAGVAAVFKAIGITFVNAAVFHPGFRNVAKVRSDLGIPTIFNILGPLCNPVRPEASAVGVASAARIPLIGGVFQKRGATALVFRGEDGLDELTTTSTSRVWEISKGIVREHVIDPLDYGLSRATLDDLRGGDAHFNADIARSVFAGAPGPVQDIVALNTAAGLVAYHLYKDPNQAERTIKERFAEQLELAQRTISDGKAGDLLNRWIAESKLAAIR